MKTYSLSKEGAEKGTEEHSVKWHIVDAAGLPLGRVATEVATLIRGKHKPTFTPHVNCGDFVIVINAAQVELTGKKWDQKKYYKHTGYVGGIKEASAAHVREEHPERLVEGAVKGMIPRGALGHQMIKRLKVYAGAEHPHSSQKPEVYELYCAKRSQAAAQAAA